MSQTNPKFKNFFRSVCVFGALIFLRICMDNQQDVSLGMVVLNFIALDYVFFDIFGDGYQSVKNKFKHSQLPASTIRRKIRFLRTVLFALFFLIFVLEICYSLFWEKQLINDILAILGLFLSIESNTLISTVDSSLSKLSGIWKE